MIKSGLAKQNLKKVVLSEGKKSTDDIKIDEKVRPSTFSSIIGREAEKKALKMMIDSAKRRGEPLDHILFYGPPGLGKTTFSMAIANELGGSLKVTSGPAIERQGDLVAILTNLKANDVFFIDEIHRLSRNIEEILYPAMEDRVVDIIMGKGASAKSIRLNLEPFTLVGATTQIGRISSPMRDRFGIVQRLDYFPESDVVKILERAARIEGISFSDEALKEIASRARGTGRVALRLLRRVRDFAVYHNTVEGIEIDENVTKEALEMLGIDTLGLEDIDRLIVSTILNNFEGGPVGLSTLSAALSEDELTISDVYEPFLIKLGLLKRGSRGRILTEKGILYATELAK